MMNYRNPKYIERYEDVVFELDTALVTPGNGLQQIKTNHTIVVDGSGEINPFDWYHARLNVKFKLQLAAAGGNIAAAVQTGMVNSAFSLINRIDVKMNGISVYDCSDVNQAMNIKNLLEYSKGYANSLGTNEFFYLDTKNDTGVTEFSTLNVKVGTANPAGSPAENANQSVLTNKKTDYNSGFAVRHTLLVNNAEVNAEIPLNRYGFFERLQDELLPNSKIELKITLESDANLVWRTGGAASRVVLTQLQLLVPRITFNANGLKLYTENYLINKKCSYLREQIYSSDSTQQSSGSYRITTGINKPRHVFVSIINQAKQDSEEANKFLYNTFAPSDQTLDECRLVVGNGRDYPEVYYRPKEEPTRVFRDVMKYVHANSEYAHDSILTRSNFSSIFSFIYFDLTKQPTDIKDGSTKLTFHYKLSAGTAAAYKIYALIFYEQDIELIKTSGKLMLRSMLII